MPALLLTLVSTIVFAEVASAQNRVALVIGNSSYQHVGVLPNPANDAADMTAVLQALGFKVISSGNDLSKSAMDAKIREFTNALSNSDVAVFFYAGHGLQYQGQNYLIPVDAELRSVAALQTEAVRLDIIQSVMESQSKQSILFFDACRNNPFAQTLVSSGRSLAPGLALQAFGVGTLVSFSAQPGSVAADGDGRNSPYAGPLAKLLNSSSDDLVSILMLVRKNVLASTGGQQVPWDQNSLLDKIYLKPGGGASVPVAEAPRPTTTAAITPAAVAPRATLHTVWYHNKSELLLLSSGDRRSFYYKTPSAAVAEAGVKPGTLLFEGRVEGGQYVGTAYRFSSKCAARAYQVSGPIGDDGRRVSLKGQVRKLNSANCTLQAPYTDDLEFTYMRSE